MGQLNVDNDTMDGNECIFGSEKDGKRKCTNDLFGVCCGIDGKGLD
jgi:hypothetical protein